MAAHAFQVGLQDEPAELLCHRELLRGELGKACPLPGFAGHPPAQIQARISCMQAPVQRPLWSTSRASLAIATTTKLYRLQSDWVVSKNSPDEEWKAVLAPAPSQPNGN